jgi:hypothetical protein
MTTTPIFSEPGSFVVGCNYWASHAGTAMWSDWQPEVVADDLARLADSGIQLIRVFPLWPDFQPVALLRGGGGKPMEYRRGEQPFSDDDAGRAGVSVVACERFAALATLAERNNLQLVVSLITGWMSGRLFVPPALEGRNVLTDPMALMWQVRFVQYFVRRFRGTSAIVAWDLGNECNVMGSVTQREAAWHWTATITNAIRATDPSRPVISGMHSLTPEGIWTMQDQGELTDVLTTHPYPLWTPHASQDAINTMRTLLHATAESRLYADLGDKPCIAEEIGTMGPMMGSDAAAAAFARTNLFSLWAHDCRAFLWWSAFDQDHLTATPYDWFAVERELGLLTGEKRIKPVLESITAFRAVLADLPFRTLPTPTTEAVCVLTHDQDHWGIAYSAFLLAKQAGFDLQFRFADQPLPPAPLYMLPSITGHRVMSRRRWHALLERVAAGATLYISYDDGSISGFEELTGMRVLAREARRAPVVVRLEGDSPVTLTLHSPNQLVLEPTRAAVLATEANGNPILSCASYGQGFVFFLAAPLERAVTETIGACDLPDQGFWRMYAPVAQTVLGSRAVTKYHPHIGVTEHPLSERQRVVVLINYMPQAVVSTARLTAPWQVSTILYGDGTPDDRTMQIRIAANDALVFLLER